VHFLQCSQELVVPKILTGKDIVLAAETGSGKTLAYIAPLSSLLLHRAAAGQLPPTAELLTQHNESSRAQDDSGYKPKLR
jgi:superfamily II DNA/RNA helicase